jgi:mRNA-degrading endonuclease YafQ of YafQ-DinJ toxin-antitoxin module
MYAIYETKLVTKQIKKLQGDVARKYKAWVEIVKWGGPRNLIHYPGFKDEALKGNLKGYRSSRLNLLYRVIYSPVKAKQELVVWRITPHQY